MNQKLYERYHKTRKLQKRIIDDWNFTYRNMLSVLNHNLSGRDDIFDVGCGASTIDFYLASKGKKVLGIDISEKAVKVARENAKRFGLDKKIKYLVRDFPKESVVGKFDLVVCSEVLEHLSEDKNAIEKIYKLLRNKGILILSTPSRNAPLYRWGLLKGHDRWAGHLRRYTTGSLRRVAENAGFEVLYTKRTEGIIRNLLFVFPLLGSQIVRVANRFKFFSDLLTFIDNISLKLLGESQVYLIAQRR